MQIFVLTAPLCKRESDAITSLSASLLLIVMVNPYAAADTGLQLSFAATLGMVLFSSKLYEAMSGLSKLKNLLGMKAIGPVLRFILACTATTFGALAFSLPLTALYFGNISLIAPITNLLVLWAVSIAFCGGLAACLLGVICPPLGTAAAFLVAFPARYISAAVSLLSKLQFSALYTSNRAVVLWLVFLYANLLLFFVFRGRLRKLLLPISLSAAGLALVLTLSTLYGDSGRFTATVLDVGQGQSILATSGAATAVIDCGSGTRGDAGDITADYLSGLGRNRIDLLVLTHFHEDHADGVPELMNRIAIGAIAVPDLAEEDSPLSEQIISLARQRDIDIIYVKQNLTLTIGTSTLRLIAPLGSVTENERGLTILCSASDFDMLVTGDMDEKIEKRLVLENKFPSIELYIAGHHGSRYSSSETLLNSIHPQTAVISVGYNTYGQPSQEVLDRLKSDGVTVYRTDQSGTITVKSW